MPESTRFRPILKIAFVAVNFCGLLATVWFAGRDILVKTAVGKETILIVPFKNTLWQDFGVVMEPEISLEVKTTQKYERQVFLLDSGAIISALPREAAQKLGQNLAFLPRSTFQGFGNTQTFAYQGEMKVRIGTEETTLPVVFTEAAGTKAILGRKGFFEKYTIAFDHQRQRIEIKK